MFVNSINAGESKKGNPGAFISSIEFVAKVLQALPAVACATAKALAHAVSVGRPNNK